MSDATQARPASAEENVQPEADDQPGSSDPQLVEKSARWKRVLKRVLIDAVLIYVVLCVAIMVMQRKLMYVPTRSKTPLQLPATSSATVHEVHIPTSDGLSLAAWLFTAHQAPAKSAEPLPDLLNSNRPMILFFHGNGGNRAGRENDALLLAGTDADVLLVDYRGYAENAGSPSESGLQEDARAAYRLVTEEWNVHPARIVLYGESLGGAVAVSLAAEVEAKGQPLAGLILRSTFSSMGDVAAAHYPWLPVRWMLWDRWPSIERIVALRAPLLMIHGDHDKIVPLKFGQRLFAAAPEVSQSGQKKELLIIRKATHNRVFDLARGTINSHVRDFIQRSRSKTLAHED